MSDLVTMKPGQKLELASAACPLLPGKHYVDLELDDPARKTIAEIRPIRDEIGRRVDDLLDRLEIQHP
jgi:arsenate reductase (thioredoxin)